MLYWLFEFKELGGHTHVKVRCGLMDHSRGLAGTLVFRNEEFAEFRWMVEKRTNRVSFEEMSDEVARVSQARHPVEP